MPENPTDNSRYKSPSTGDYCTCAQYVAEIVCSRVAEKENIGTQAHKFWNTAKWRKMYQYQVVLANRLIKKYPEAAVVKAVHSPECRRMYSLRFPPLEAIIKKYQKIIEHQVQNSTTIEVRENSVSRKSRSYGKKSGLQKLRELDGKKEGE
jgi:hypothetical protein